MSKDSLIQQAIDATDQCNGNITKASILLGVPRTTIADRVRAGQLLRPSTSPVELPTFPDEDIPIEEIIDSMSKRFEKRHESYKAHTWFPIKFKSNEPIGILFFGDEHVDDNGCNWPILKKHTEICKNTEGLYGISIGDHNNNWAGRLEKLYAEQDTSISTARKLVEWLLLDSGVDWLIIILGNHDGWASGGEIIQQMLKRGTKKIVCHDWEARFTLNFPNEWKPRINCAHDFKGHSMWNPMHGPMKAGAFTEADVFVCGHKHNWGLFTYENPNRSREQHFIRVRGYKFLDDYARRLSLKEQEGGCSILTVFDPSRKSATSFSDVERGVEFLNMIRK